MRSGFFWLLTLLCVALPLQAADEYRTYINARFGTTVQYPANLVSPRPESQNGDGRRFLSKDKLIELTVYASHNIDRSTVKTQMNRAISDWKRDGGRLTYYKWEAGWYTASGYIGDDIFYEKGVLKNGVFHTLIWQYPKSFKARLDAPVTRTVRSFMVASGAEAPSPRPTPRPAKKTTRPTPRATPHPTPVPGNITGGY